jgi:hypothetical protein
MIAKERARVQRHDAGIEILKYSMAASWYIPTRIMIACFTSNVNTKLAPEACPYDLQTLSVTEQAIEAALPLSNYATHTKKSIMQGVQGVAAARVSSHL